MWNHGQPWDAGPTIPYPDCKLLENHGTIPQFCSWENTYNFDWAIFNNYATVYHRVISPAKKCWFLFAQFNRWPGTFGDLPSQLPLRWSLLGRSTCRCGAQKSRWTRFRSPEDMYFISQMCQMFLATWNSWVKHGWAISYMDLLYSCLSNKNKGVMGIMGI